MLLENVERSLKLSKNNKKCQNQLFKYKQQKYAKQIKFSAYRITYREKQNNFNKIKRLSNKKIFILLYYENETRRNY